MTRDWGEAPYIRLYATLPTDPKTAGLWRDDQMLAAYTRLLMASDLAWPMPQSLPRWLADDVLDALAAADVVRVHDDTYEIVGLRSEREGRKSGRAAGGYARVETARRAADGTFLPVAGPDAGDAGDAGDNAGPATVQPSKPARRDETSRAAPRRIARAREEPSALDAPDEPEGPALTWLARHHIDIRPGNGYHQKLVVSVERHGVVALIREFEKLAAAGMPAGDVKGFVFGAIDALDRARRPTLAAVAQVDGAERASRAVEITRRKNAELVAIGTIDGTLADHAVPRPGAS